MNLNQFNFSGSYLLHLLPQLKARYGVAVENMLARSGLDQGELARPNQFVALPQLVNFFECLLAETGDDNLGLFVGSCVKPRSYQVLGYAIMSSATLQDAIEQLVQYEAAAGQLGRTRFFVRKQTASLHWYFPVAGRYGRHIREAAIAGWVAMARQLLPVSAAPQAVYFEHPAPASIAEHEAFFDCPVTFGTDATGVDFDARWLATPLNEHDPALNALMQQQARKLIGEVAGNDLVDRLREMIGLRLGQEEPTLEALAAVLEKSPRTLQKLLQQQGVTFSGLVDEVRRAQAMWLMKDEDMTLTEIALSLGFSEQSSFSRAFRRWTGCSPTAYRKLSAGDSV